MFYYVEHVNLIVLGHLLQLSLPILTLLLFATNKEASKIVFANNSYLISCLSDNNYYHSYYVF